MMLALLGHAAALQPAVASMHARKVHRTPTVHALAGGRGAALATGLSLVVSQAASAAEAVAPWAYSTLLDEIDAKHVTSALLSNDGKQVLTIDTQGVRHESQAGPHLFDLELLRPVHPSRSPHPHLSLTALTLAALVSHSQPSRAPGLRRRRADQPHEGCQGAV